jgi:transcriptional regulator with XRE-family HTH domain
MKANGKKIRKVRMALGLTIGEFAKKAKVTRQAIQGWEKGKISTFKTLTKVARILNIKEKELITWEN